MSFMKKDYIEIKILFNVDVVKYWFVKLFGIGFMLNFFMEEFFSFCGCFSRLFFDV